MISVSAPASSGNLGPGFDMMGLALEMRCRVSAGRADEWTVEHVGQHQLPAGDIDAVLVAAKAAIGETHPLHLVVDNDVPLARGLGSSSAARAAGCAAALMVRDGGFDPRAVFELVAEFEGHGDNAAATVFGGLVAIGADGNPMPLTLDSDWRIVVAIPNYELATSKARAALSPEISRATVVRNSGRLVALVEGLRSGSVEALQRAAGDEVHEQPRAILHERAGELMAAARRGGAAHAAWSGAGPTILAIAKPERLDDVVELMQVAMGDQGAVRHLDVATNGLVA